jgi:hypothetical protein
MPIVVTPSGNTPQTSNTTMLQLMQQACAELGLSVPSQVSGNTAADIVQLLALLNAVGYEILRYHEWQKLLMEYRLTTDFLEATGDCTTGSAVISNMSDTSDLSSSWMVTGEGVPQDTYVASVDSSSQVTLTQPLTSTATGGNFVFTQTKYQFPDDFDRMVNRTQWDKTNHWEMIGPMSSQQWQWLKSGYIQTTPRVRFRQMGGLLQIWPPIGTASYYGFEYVSRNWVVDFSGESKSSFQLDDDTCIFPDRLMVLGLKLKYFEIKGFDTTAFYRDFNYQLDAAKAMDAGAPTLNLTPTREALLIGYDSIPDSGYGR